MASLDQQAWTRTDPQRLRRFAVALDHAIQDVKIENNKPIHFYFDTDVVIKTVLGYTLLEESLPEAADPPVVLRALLTTPATPRLRVLRPHLVEFDRRIPSQVNATVAERDAQKRQMEYLNKIWDFRQYERTLREIHSIGDPDRAQERFLQFIREEGVQVFVKLQLCLGGTWNARLRRMWKDRRFDLRPHRFHEAFPGDDHVTRLFFQALAKERTKSYQVRNNLVDASALMLLSKLAAEDSTADVRFYTNTHVVRKLFSHPDLGHRLMGQNIQGQALTLLRDELYFLIRASFQSLSFSSADRAQDGDTKDDGYTFEELDRYATDLRDALGGSSLAPAGHDLLSEVRLRGRPADVVLGEFYELEFLRKVVLDWTVPEGMREWIPHLYKVYENPTFIEEADEELASEVEEVRAELSGQIGGLKHWRANFDRIRAAAERKRAHVKAEDPVPGLVDDLGLGRWGIEGYLSDPDRITTTIGKLLYSDDEELAVECSRFAALTALPPEVADPDLEYILCVLWFLQVPELLCQAWETVPEASPIRSVPGFETLYLVSLVKSLAKPRAPRSEEAIRRMLTIVGEAESKVAGYSGRERGFALMGLAHVCYWAWYHLQTRTSKKTHALQPALLPLAQSMGKKSLAAAEDAMDALEPESHAWYFAVNHATYVGIATGADVDTTARHYDILLSAPLYRLHYRFADTLAYLHLHSAKKQIENHSYRALLKEEFRNVRVDICRDLRRAEEYLHTAGPCYGDEEVIQHRQQIDADLTRLGCLEV